MLCYSAKATRRFLSTAKQRNVYSWGRHNLPLSLEPNLTERLHIMFWQGVHFLYGQLSDALSTSTSSNFHTATLSKKDFSGQCWAPITIMSTLWIQTKKHYMWIDCTSPNSWTAKNLIGCKVELVSGSQLNVANYNFMLCPSFSIEIRWNSPLCVTAVYIVSLALNLVSKNWTVALSSKSREMLQVKGIEKLTHMDASMLFPF